MYSELPDIWEHVRNTPRINRIDLIRTVMIVETYGLPCQWEKIRFVKDGREVYRLTLDDKRVTRREYFFGEQEPFRKYDGDQFCFVEFCRFIENQGRFLETDDLIKIGLDANLAEGYKKFAQRIVAE